MEKEEKEEEKEEEEKEEEAKEEEAAVPLPVHGVREAAAVAAAAAWCGR